MLILVAADLHRTGHRIVVTTRAADLFTPPPVLATLPDPSARLWTDRLFFPTSPPQRFELEAARIHAGLVSFSSAMSYSLTGRTCGAFPTS